MSSSRTGRPALTLVATGLGLFMIFLDATMRGAASSAESELDEAARLAAEEDVRLDGR